MNTKKTFTRLFGSIAFLFFATTGFSQSGVPEGILFQALARDPSGIPAKGRTIHIKDAIIQTTATGTVVLCETFTVEASDEGVFTITIGKGTKVSGANKLSDINWGAGPYFLNIKAAIEPSILTPEWKVDEQYVDMGTSQFWTVPFAFRAANVAGMELLLKSADTTSMLSPYLRKNDTASLSDRINRSLKITDTINMLSSYLKKNDTASLNDLMGGYLKIMDTGNLLSPYLQKNDTASLSYRIGRSLKIADTSNMLSSYLKKNDTVSVNSFLSSSLKLTDTSNMLLPYLKKADTVSLSDRIDRSLKIADTVSMLSPYLKKTDTASLSDRIDKSLKITDTVNMLSSYFKKDDNAAFDNLATGKLNTSDTSAMLTAYLRKADLPAGGTTAAVDTFTTNLVVYATNGLGKYGPGQTIPSKGKTAAQVLMDVIMQTIPPTYAQPTVSISSTPSPGNVEIGSALSVSLSAVFTQNDAGAKTNESFSKNGSPLGNNTDNIPSLTSAVSYTTTVSYAQGAVKNNNTGVSDPTGQIVAGSKTSSAVSFTPQAKRYWGYASSITPTDAEIRAALGGGSELSSSKAKSSFDITISGGANYIFYAYPVSLGALSSLSVGGFGSLPSFTLITRSFTNASGYSQSYNIYLNQNAFSTPVSNIITN